MSRTSARSLPVWPEHGFLNLPVGVEVRKGQMHGLGEIVAFVATRRGGKHGESPATALTMKALGETKQLPEWLLERIEGIKVT